MHIAFVPYTQCLSASTSTSLLLTVLHSIHTMSHILYCVQATGDPYYLEVGKSVLENLDRLARVPCGFAAIKDLTTGTHEDQYVLHK